MPGAASMVRHRHAAASSSPPASSRSPPPSWAAPAATSARSAPSSTTSRSRRPTDPAPAFPPGLDKQVPGITPFRIKNADFYRVDTRLDTPIIDQNDWSLTIDGDVDKEITLTYDDIMAMDLIERDITLTCVSNSVGGKYVGGARWLGVRLQDLLDLAGVGTKADQIFATDVDGMTISTPLALATDGRDAMLAIGMNGEVLPREHGFPARIVIPGLYGFISATKWVTKLTLTTYDEKSVVLDPARLGHRRAHQDLQPDRHPEAARNARQGRGRHRRRRLGAAERWRRQGPGPRRRRCLAGRRARPDGRQRLLAPVVLQVGRRLRLAHHRGPRHRRQRQRADHRACAAVPRGLQRHPGAIVKVG